MQVQSTIVNAIVKNNRTFYTNTLMWVYTNTPTWELIGNNTPTWECIGTDTWIYTNTLTRELNRYRP